MRVPRAAFTGSASQTSNGHANAAKRRLPCAAPGTHCGLSKGSGLSSAGAPLKLPRRDERVLDGTCVAVGEVGDNQHVLAIPDGHAEGFGKLL